MDARVLARVALPVPGRGDGVFQYEIPAKWQAAAVTGSAVVVPLGKRRVNGFVVGFDSEPFPGVRPILAVADQPAVLPYQLQWAEWMSTHYQCPLYDALRLMGPPGSDGGTLVTSAGDHQAIVDAIAAYGFPGPVEKQVCALVPDCAGTGLGLSECLRRLDPEARLAFRTLLADGVFASDRGQNRAERKPVAFFTVAPGLDRESIAEMLKNKALTPRQSQALMALVGESPGRAAELARKCGCSMAVLHALIEKGVLQSPETPESLASAAEEAETLEAPHALNLEQAAAATEITKALDSGKFASFLLFGVTGSGKTEVYMQCVAAVMRQGRQAILAVPEIALTPQLLRRVKARFGRQVALLHSAMPAGERRSEWYRIARGEAGLVLGARSALFAPVPRPGLIILDEEHETSFKQEESPRYHARDAAEWVARHDGAVLLLGSATPSVESYYRAQTGETTLLNLPGRIGGRPMPQVSVVDMRQELKAHNRSVFSVELRDAIAATLGRQEQTILFLNRRGYSTFVLCRECGHVLKCPHCDVSLTYHSSGVSMRCHYCGHEMRPPETCPKCRSRAIRYFGSGTEKVEEELARLFPAARVARMDVDTTTRKGSHDRIYMAMAERRVDILVGTQMVAKGLDLPDVTLVGIISADTALHLPDFRAGERTFQLITQVSGRAGRGDRPGRVILQTYNPAHYSVLAGARQDYPGFFGHEIEQRCDAFYPPFSTLVKVTATGPTGRQAEEALTEWADEFGRQCAQPKPGTIGPSGVIDHGVGKFRYEVLGPVPCPVSRVQNRFRFQLLLKATPEAELMEAVRKTCAIVRPVSRGTLVAVDVNPYSTA